MYVLDYARNLPLLSVMMDQGSVGCSAFAFYDSLAGYFVNIDFDKYHRLANDSNRNRRKTRRMFATKPTCIPVCLVSKLQALRQRCTLRPGNFSTVSDCCPLDGRFAHVRIADVPYTVCMYLIVFIYTSIQYLFIFCLWDTVLWM